MEDTSLENAIRQTAEQAIKSVQEKEESRIKHLDEVCAAEIEAYRAQNASETQAGIEQELSRQENRAALERKKLKLTSLEDFIHQAVAEVVGEIRSIPRYQEFLIKTIREALGLIAGDVEVSVGPDDLGLEPQIRAAVPAAGKHRSIRIQVDTSIAWGGCLIRDEEGGRIFNGTIERIYERQAPTIRREIMRVLEKRHTP